MLQADKNWLLEMDIQKISLRFGKGGELLWYWTVKLSDNRCGGVAVRFFFFCTIILIFFACNIVRTANLNSVTGGENSWMSGVPSLVTVLLQMNKEDARLLYLSEASN